MENKNKSENYKQLKEFRKSIQSENIYISNRDIIVYMLEHDITNIDKFINIVNNIKTYKQNKQINCRHKLSYNFPHPTIKCIYCDFKYECECCFYCLGRNETRNNNFPHKYIDYNPICGHILYDLSVCSQCKRPECDCGHICGCTC